MHWLLPWSFSALILPALFLLQPVSSDVPNLCSDTYALIARPICTNEDDAQNAARYCMTNDQLGKCQQAFTQISKCFGRWDIGSDIVGALDDKMLRLKKCCLCEDKDFPIQTFGICDDCLSSMEMNFGTNHTLIIPWSDARRLYEIFCAFSGRAEDYVKFVMAWATVWPIWGDSVDQDTLNVGSSQLINTCTSTVPAGPDASAWASVLRGQGSASATSTDAPVPSGSVNDSFTSIGSEISNATPTAGANVDEGDNVTANNVDPGEQTRSTTTNTSTSYSTRTISTTVTRPTSSYTASPSDYPWRLYQSPFDHPLLSFSSTSSKEAESPSVPETSSSLPLSFTRTDISASASTSEGTGESTSEIATETEAAPEAARLTGMAAWRGAAVKGAFGAPNATVTIGVAVGVIVGAALLLAI